MRLRSCVPILLALAAAACRTTAPVPDARHPMRAIWVTRFDYETADDVRRVIDDVARAGFDTVLFQVRGNGTAFYRSALEPWADELGGRDPGFDPLALAVEQAHARSLELHAWVNVIPSWRGPTPPRDARQLYLARPEWHWYDGRGQRQPLADGFYVNLNPCLPEVRDYLVSVFREIVAGYDVDGLHLDYVRFVDDLVTEDYPRDQRTLALYREATGKHPDDDEHGWKAWRGEQVTALVRAIRAMVDAERRDDCVLSAAVGSTPETAVDRHLRASREWAENGIVHAVFPMNYTPDLGLFAERVEAWRAVESKAAVVTGVNVDPARSTGVLEEEIRLARRASGHVSLFAYASLFPRADDVRAKHRRLVLARALADRPGAMP